MKAVQITRPRNAEIIEVEKPVLNDGDVRVRIQKTCLCGSDIPYFAYDQQKLLIEGKPNAAGHIDYSQPKVYPLPVGLSLHECVGVVVESASSGFQEGDFVLALPFDQCGFFEYLTLPESRIFPLPEESVSKQEILMAQPLGTLLFAWRMMPEIEGKTVAVVGQGPIGLMFNSLLKLRGAGTVIGIDRLKDRAGVGQQMGADEIIVTGDAGSVEQLSDLTNGDMADVVIEAVGHADLAFNDAVDMVREEGTILEFGVVDTDYVDNYPFGKVFYKNLTVRHSVGAKDKGDFLAAAALIAEGKVDVKPLLTHSFPFASTQKAYETFVDRNDGAIKVLIDFE